MSAPFIFEKSTLDDPLLPASLTGCFFQGFRFGMPIQEIDLADTRRRLELKQLGGQFGVHVPAVDEGRVLRLVNLPLESEQKFARQRLVAGVDPDLPVQNLLPKRQVMAL